MSKRRFNCVLVVMVLVLISGLYAGAFDLPSIYALRMGFLLVLVLSHSLRTHKLLLMQAATVGLLFVMLMT